jgi:ABC-type glycerol-3-phosphate transport system permease component
LPECWPCQSFWLARRCGRRQPLPATPTHFAQLPEALREAALMDNASEVRVFYSIMLPLVRPGLAAVATFTAIQAWNEFLFGLRMTTGARPRR